VKHIYPDTIIWNLLCDQNIDPRRLLDSLTSKGFTLVVSFHTVYELARNFERDHSSGNARGRQLFSYVKQYLDFNMPCTKELWELIIAEAYAFENDLREIDPLATPEQCAVTKQEVEKLANGVIEGRVKAFLEERRQFAKDTQAQQKAHIIDRDDLSQYLRGIPESGLATWMQSETLTASGVSTLYRRFVQRIGPGPTPEYILQLLRFPLAEAARASVRADLYFNWHCAMHGSNRLDLLDDMLHVLQAIYCDLYITEEKKQSRYAPLLLTSRTGFAVYPDRNIAVDKWLLNTLGSRETGVELARRLP
jgi:hypothetical protein